MGIVFVFFKKFFLRVVSSVCMADTPGAAARKKSRKTVTKTKCPCQKKCGRLSWVQTSMA
jgi:hypothetical protein